MRDVILTLPEGPQMLYLEATSETDATVTRVRRWTERGWVDVDFAQTPRLTMKGREG